jgi:hypothetical protein
VQDRPRRVRVEVLHARRDVQQQAEAAPRRQGGVELELVPEGASVGVLHEQAEAARLDAHTEQLDDVRMLQSAHRAHLLGEVLSAAALLQRGRRPDLLACHEQAAASGGEVGVGGLKEVCAQGYVGDVGYAGLRITHCRPSLD